MLKILWDYVHLVRSSIDDWKTTPWESINVEQMDMDCKKFAKVAQSKSHTTSHSVFPLQLPGNPNQRKKPPVMPGIYSKFSAASCYSKFSKKNP